MKTRVVVFAPEARVDLLQLHDWLANAASPAIALKYVERLETYCDGFRTAGELGHRRDDLRPGLRIAGFEKRITIALAADDERVTILRLFYGGRNWETILADKE